MATNTTPPVSTEPKSATPSNGDPVPVQRHYAAGEVADLWHFNVETIRRLFDNEPGVIVLQAPARKGRRAYKTIRIPETVLDRVHKRLQS